MGDVQRPWRIDPGVARGLADAFGWAPGDGVAALAGLVPAFVPVGSTAKLAAIAVGDVPPGADVDALARRVLDHCVAVAQRPGGGAPSPSWSCWVLATVMAAVVDGADVGRVRVAATRRVDDASPIVDLHAAVLVDGDGDGDGGAGGEGHGDGDGGAGATWVCDPYFGFGVALSGEAGAVGAADLPLSEAAAVADGEGGWTLDVRLRRWAEPLRYRLLAPALDRADVHAMAAISVSHTGVPARPYARLHVGGTIVDASETAEGTGLLRTWSPEAGGVELALDDWSSTVAAFAERTGTRIV